MKHKVAIAAGAAAGFLFWLLALAGGYFVDPALWPLGFLYPLLGLLLAAGSFLTGITYCLGCLGLFFLKKNKLHIGVALIALIGPAIVVTGPRLLNGYDAFVYRMKSFSEAEYHRLAADVKAKLDEQGVRSLPADTLFNEHESVEIPRALIESHRILQISNFPLGILARDESVSLRWGSGLTGGYTVAISLSADPPSGWADDLRQGIYNLPVTYIYAGVAAARLP